MAKLGQSPSEFLIGKDADTEGRGRCGGLTGSGLAEITRKGAAEEDIAGLGPEVLDAQEDLSNGAGWGRLPRIVPREELPRFDGRGRPPSGGRTAFEGEVGEGEIVFGGDGEGKLGASGDVLVLGRTGDAGNGREVLEGDDPAGKGGAGDQAVTIRQLDAEGEGLVDGEFGGERLSGTIRGTEGQGRRAEGRGALRVSLCRFEDQARRRLVIDN
jgi:hypothetical protein